jgi:hypothetical protein
VAQESVIVCCSLPNGLICRVGDKRVHLRGSANYIQPNPKRKFKGPDPQSVVYQHTMTPVDKEFWDAFVKNMGPDFAPFKSGAIYWAKDKGSATAQAKDAEGMRTGFEQLNPGEHGVQSVDAKPSASNPMKFE